MAPRPRYGWQQFRSLTCFPRLRGTPIRLELYFDELISRGTYSSLLLQGMTGTSWTGATYLLMQTIQALIFLAREWLLYGEEGRCHFSKSVPGQVAGCLLFHGLFNYVRLVLVSQRQQKKKNSLATCNCTTKTPYHDYFQILSMEKRWRRDIVM